ncbi:MAG TPA: hypothetical protein PLG15_06495 [Candidatus Gastranaerophilaceae bacterium]|nr:hypothetical protein [Candidatus Gastranaerophilaceae bacterium]HPT42015.1 hypothetical protein [Candidatus Gastranaerophilaceae bacterium]
MREIKNDVMFGNIQQKKEVKTGKLNSVIPQVEGKDTDDLSVSSEVLGRAQVNSPDALQKDVSFASAHPEAIEKADKFFDMTYKTLCESGDTDAYAKASLLTKAYVDEFQR